MSDQSIELGAKVGAAPGNPENDRDPQRWLELFGNYLFRYAYVRLKNREAAEDVVQETLLSAHKALAGFEGRSSVKTWLVSILKNKIIDQVRKRSREVSEQYDELGRDQVVDECFSSLGIWKKKIGTWDGSPEDLFERKDFMRRVVECLEGLPDSLRSVFMLRALDDISTDEICSRLDITPNNLWVIFYRSRMRLRDCLDRKWFSGKGK